MSATKWLTAIELCRRSTTFDGYWIPRGWSKQARSRPQSRIDVPARPAIAAGPADGRRRGVGADPRDQRVEVQVDDGPWQAAALAAAISDDTWVQWLFRWQAEPGDHTIAVRATDDTGYTQTAEETDVAPNGATGHHTIRVTVE